MNCKPPGGSARTIEAWWYEITTAVGHIVGEQLNPQSGYTSSIQYFPFTNTISGSLYNWPIPGWLWAFCRKQSPGNPRYFPKTAFVICF